jgi:hypothetical protein
LRSLRRSLWGSLWGFSGRSSRRSLWGFPRRSLRRAKRVLFDWSGSASSFRWLERVFWRLLLGKPQRLLLGKPQRLLLELLPEKPQRLPQRLLLRLLKKKAQLTFISPLALSFY